MLMDQVLELRVLTRYNRYTAVYMYTYVLNPLCMTCMCVHG